MSVNSVNRMKKCRTLAGCLLALLSIGAHEVRAEPVEVGVGIDPGYVAFFVAKQEGLFAKHNVDVRFTNFAAGPEALDAIIAGTVNVAAAAEVSTIIRMGRGDVKAVAVVTQSGKFLKMAGKTDIVDPGAIKSLGVVPGGAMEYLANLTINKYGLDLNRLKIVKAGPPEMAALLVRGDIDAFWLFEPFPSVAVRQGGKILAASGDVGYIYNFWVTANGAWLESNKSKLEAINAALADACVLTKRDPQRAAEAVRIQAKIPLEQTLEFLKQIDCTMRDFTDKDYESYDSVADFLVKSKITPARVDYRKKIVSGFYKP
ncbi:ABC transporter substrate-binding protein [Agrobacterium pusense]|uniref:ABC transporter substrate-binding protein n=1 Tax=Agrobacterium pusense TaxID=648995 RepID=UPI00156B7D81|nr:ABC transporter substrate-binding protein [Agrobacterium pusense]QKJ94459.1 ABC transporter substrate-binding protein [Agrobacterium pusense]